MAWYSAGTVTATNNSTTVTGSGTAFLSNVRVGDGITIAGSTSMHEVTAVASDTQLTISPAYTGTTGASKAYRVAPMLGYDKDLSDAFNTIRLNWGTQLSALKPWATAATAAQARTDLGAGTTGSSLFTASTPAAGRTALGLGNAATATVQSNATDTTAGALMAVGAFGLGVPVTSNTLHWPNTSLNNCEGVAQGFYRAIASTTDLPPGFSTSCTLLFQIRQSGGVNGFGFTQTVIDTAFNRIAFRTSIVSANSSLGTLEWRPWSTLYHTNNILGTVSQSGGVPTGAIIERGSNANGRFTKYACGTVIMDNSGNAITTNPVTTVGAVTSVDSNKLRYGFWY